MTLFKLHKYDESIEFFRKSDSIYPSDTQTKLQIDKCISSLKKENLLKSLEASNSLSLI